MQQRHSVERLLARANAHVWAARPAALVAAVLELEVAIRYLLHLVIVQLFALKVQDFCDLKPLKFTVLLHFVWVRGRNRRVGRPEIPFAGEEGGFRCVRRGGAMTCELIRKMQSEGGVREHLSCT